MKRKLIIAALLAMLLPILALPALAAADRVDDGADILTAAEEQALEQLAEEVSDRIGSEVYIVTMENFWDYGAVGSVRACAEAYYTDHGLGRGEEREGILLLLSMEDRDYALIFHGRETCGIFTNSRQEDLTDAFLDDFRYDDWYGGLTDYVEGCRDGVRGKETASVLVILLVPLVAAAIACGVMAAMMKTARRQTHANVYIPDGGVRVTASTDRFINRTEVRRQIQTSSSSGSSRSSGGFSGRSGKF